MALGDFRTIVKNCIENGLEEENVRIIVSDLETTKVEFLDFVQSIGPSVVDPNKNTRLNATKLLSEVVNKLKSSFFSEQEVEVLLEFMCEKFTDTVLIVPTCLKGLAALTKADCLSKSSMEYVIRSIFRDLEVAELIYPDRSLVFSIFEYFIKNRLEDLKDMNGEFVIGFVQMLGTEGDPRNLMLLFELLSIVASNIPLGAVAEELFDWFKAYFPIDFPENHSTSDRTITRDDLSGALKKCFASSPRFAEYVLPVLIEAFYKDSNSNNAKLDALEYLRACCEVYHPDSIAEFSDKIWFAIRQTIFSSTVHLDANCLLTLVAMVKNLSLEFSSDYNKEDQPTENLKNFLDSIFKDCSRYIMETSLSIFHQSTKILLAVSSASVQSSRHLLGKLIDIIVKEFDIQKQTAARIQLVKYLLVIIQSDEIPHTDILFTDTTFKQNCIVLEEILKDRKIKILEIIDTIGESQSPDLKSLSSWGSVVVTAIGCFTEDEKVTIVKRLTVNAIVASDDVVRKSVLSSLKSLSKIRNDLCNGIVFPQLSSALLTDLNNKSEFNEDRTGHLIRSIVHLAHGRELVQKSATQLLRIITDLCENNQDDVRIMSSCVEGLVNLVESNLEGDATEYLTSQFLVDCCHAILKISKHNLVPEVSAEYAVVESSIEGLASCIRMIVENSDLGLVKTFTEAVIDSFLEAYEKHEEIGESDKSLKAQLHLVLAGVCSAKDQEQLKDVNRVTESCFDVARNSNDLNTSVVASKCFAALVNKTIQSDFFDEILQKCEDELLIILTKNSDELIEEQQKCCNLWCWITKALVARNHPKQMLFANQMVDMLSSQYLSSTSKDGFRIVLSDLDDVMSLKTNSKITIMYKQRFFSLTIYRLADAFYVSQSDLKTNFLESLSYMNDFVPDQAIHQELKLILPLLVQSLDNSSTPEVWMSSLSTLLSFIASKPGEIQKYLDDILPRLLEICAFPDKMVIRIGALKCLHLLPNHLPATVLLPRKAQVLQKLTRSIDDHKRLVRLQASLTKCAWHLIGEPNGIQDDYE